MRGLGEIPAQDSLFCPLPFILLSFFFWGVRRGRAAAMACKSSLLRFLTFTRVCGGCKPLDLLVSHDMGLESNDRMSSEALEQPS